MAEQTGCIYNINRGYAIHTWTGKAFFPQNIRPEDVCVEDIAHGLAMTCRYGGQSDIFYSVAQHSYYCWEIAVQQNLPIEYQREALLHDAVEAYLGADFPRPYKMMIPALSEFEKMIEQQLNPILDIPVKKSSYIKTIDETMLATEMPLLFQTHGAYVWIDSQNDFIYTGDHEVMDGLPQRLPWRTLTSWSPDDAEKMFLKAYKQMLLDERKVA